MISDTTTFEFAHAGLDASYVIRAAKDIRSDPIDHFLLIL